MTVHTRSLKEIAILNKNLVLGDLPPPPSMVKDHTFALFNFWTLPLGNKSIGKKRNLEEEKNCRREQFLKKSLSLVDYQTEGEDLYSPSPYNCSIWFSTISVAWRQPISAKPGSARSLQQYI